MNCVCYIISDIVTNNLINEFTNSNTYFTNSNTEFIAITTKEQCDMIIPYVINPFAIDPVWFSIMYHCTHHANKIWITMLTTDQQNVEHDKIFVDMLYESCSSFLIHIYTAYNITNRDNYPSLMSLFKDFPDILNYKFNYIHSNHSNHRHNDWRKFMRLFCDYISNLQECYKFISRELLDHQT